MVPLSGRPPTMRMRSMSRPLLRPKRFVKATLAQRLRRKSDLGGRRALRLLLGLVGAAFVRRLFPRPRRATARLRLSALEVFPQGRGQPVVAPCPLLRFAGSTHGGETHMTD